MKKFEKVYFCTHCRKSVEKLTELYFVEENSHKGFCGELCIEKYYLPVVEKFEENDKFVKNECKYHSGDFDYLNNNNEVVEKIFNAPDEVYYQVNELGEMYYFFHKRFPEGHFGISICHMYNSEPSFIYLCSVTDSEKVVEYYKAGSKAKIKRKEDNLNLSKELIDHIEQKKSVFLAMVIQNKSEKDISFEEYPVYQKYLSNTMSEPDEIYELKDNEGDTFFSYIKTFEFNGNSFYYISLCVRDPSVEVKPELNESVFPVVSVPTTCANLYKFFKSDLIITKSIKN